ncbi:histidine--tRNA ligase [Negativibacillus massiliensis]|uniref:histidine--tRNA ligase n=1 Tax=Negativibacillus massiliensis TaxID=1871035 RepID=UPI003AF6D14B
MKMNPVKGTADYLPSQTLLRDYLQNSILETYRAAGFERILTPAIEDMENLEKSEGGDNLNLMFKILKRGDKLDAALEKQDYKNLADLGLRYDLTLPLSRFYAANRAKLSLPFKCIQIDKSYRAERPQKGRMREFVQCDIDILGSDSPLCELELIHTTAAALLKLDIGSFTIKINDRRVLKGVLHNIGIADDMMDSVCITLDKWDKIGTEGVMKELGEKEVSTESCEKIASLLEGGCTIEQAEQLCGEPTYIEQLKKIIADANELAAGKYNVVFDMLLIRGQGYYTGTVFEIQSNKFRGAIGGGGRYDGLVGKFTGENVPAVGFSIGFERIFQILEEQGFTIPGRRKRIAVICNEEEGLQAVRMTDKLREQGVEASAYIKPKKLGKFLNRLEEQGFDGFLVLGESEEPKYFEAK